MVDSERNGNLRSVVRKRAKSGHAPVRIKECSINSSDSQPHTGAYLKPLVFALTAALSVLALDLLTKRIVLDRLGPDGDRDVFTVIPGVLRFIYVRNTGSAFGLFQGSSEILKILAVVAVSLLGIYYARAAARDPLLAIALGMQIGGAFGNIIDRFRYGHVIDWIDFPRFPTFNVADSAITIGVILLMYCLLFRDPEVRQSPNNAISTSSLAEAPDEQ